MLLVLKRQTFRNQQPMGTLEYFALLADLLSHPTIQQNHQKLSSRKFRHAIAFKGGLQESLAIKEHEISFYVDASVSPKRRVSVFFRKYLTLKSRSVSVSGCREVAEVLKHNDNLLGDYLLRSTTSYYMFSAKVTSTMVVMSGREADCQHSSAVGSRL